MTHTPTHRNTDWRRNVTIKRGVCGRCGDTDRFDDDGDSVCSTCGLTRFGAADRVPKGDPSGCIHGSQRTADACPVCQGRTSSSVRTHRWAAVSADPECDEAVCHHCGIPMDLGWGRPCPHREISTVDVGGIAPATADDLDRLLNIINPS